MPPETDSKGSLTNLIRKLRFEHGEMTQQAWPNAWASRVRRSSRSRPGSTSRRCSWLSGWPGCSE